MFRLNSEKAKSKLALFFLIFFRLQTENNLLNSNENETSVFVVDKRPLELEFSTKSQV